MTTGLDDEFRGIEKELHSTFLPALLGLEEISDGLRALTCLPVKQAGLALPNPCETIKSNHDASTLICSHLIASIRGSQDFCPLTHNKVLTDGKAELADRRQADNEAKFDKLMPTFPVESRRTFTRGKETGAWLSVTPSIINGTDLSAQEFRDVYCLRYRQKLQHLPSHCDGCNSTFTVQHALSCKKGGLVIGRHNEIAGELLYLCQKAFKHSAVRDEPSILCHGTKKSKTQDEDAPEANNDRGDLIIRGFWQSSTYCVVDVRVTDTDAKSYQDKEPSKILAAQEKAKKKQYLEPCLAQRRHFTPFVASTDGLLGKEANFFAKRLVVVLAEKWNKPYSQVCGFVKARLSIALVRATHVCIRGSRVPVSRISSRIPLWDDGAGLSLFRPR